jgi:hypothetical protein
MILYQAFQIFIGGTDILEVRGQNALAGAGTLASFRLPAHRM